MPNRLEICIAMNMKDFIIRDQLQWNDRIADTLNRFPIWLRFNEWKTGTNFHYQPGLEIHITQEGEGTMVVGRQMLLQSPRSVLIFRATVPHQMICKSSYKRAVVCIRFSEEDTDLLPGLHRLIDFGWVPDDSCLSFSLNPREYQEVEQLCGKLGDELDGCGIGWERMALAHVLRLTVLLQRAAASRENSDAPMAPNGKNELVQACMDYVCSSLCEDLTLRTVAKRFAVSKEHLTRSFRKEMDISFYQYVLLQRVAEGKRLLREAPDVTVSDIAYLIGFPSASHFNRHFKALTEQTPSAYRKQWQEANTVDAQADDRQCSRELTTKC